MQRPNQGLFPPNGYRHFDVESGLEFTGDSWSDVARKIENHRRARGSPVGEPIAEIYSNFCQKHPTYCYEASSRKVFVEHQKSDKGFGGRVVAWVANLVGRASTRTVSASTARARAAICAGCPQQRDWTGSCGCSVKNVNALKDHFLKTNRVDSPQEVRALRACGALAEETSLSVWLEQPPKSVGQPQNCWRLTR
jgi:hypothetical protein